MFASHNTAHVATEGRLEEQGPEVVGGNLKPACVGTSTASALDKQEVSARKGKRQKAMIEPIRSDMDLASLLTSHLPHGETGGTVETDKTDGPHTTGAGAGTVGAIGAFVTPVSPSFTKTIRMVRHA